MASTYVNDLRLEEMATGDQSGTWGDTTNVNLELIAEAFSYGTEASFSSDADATTTIADGASDPARSLYLKVTSGVSLTATRTLTIAPNTVSKVWIIENATSGSQSISISQGSGANVTIPNGDVKVIYTDGAGAGAAVVDAFTDLNLGGTTTVAALDAGSGAITTTGTVTGNTLAGTLSTAAQPNITSVGTLTGFTSTGIDDNATSTAITIDSSENVGIGTNSPADLLDVRGNGADTYIRVGSDTAAGNDSARIGKIDSSTDFVIQASLGTSSCETIFKRNTTTETMRIDSSGNVGIGTTSPTELLNVSNSSGNAHIELTASTTGTSQFTFGDSGGTFRGGMKYVHTDDELFLRSNGSDRLTIDSSGNVGIGTDSIDYQATNRTVVHVEGSAGALLALEDTGAKSYFFQSGNDLLLENDTASGSMIFGTNNSTERMRIDSSGRLLVGNTDSTPYDRTSGNAIALGDGLISSAQEGGNAAIFNRMTSNGSIAGFRYAGTEVGSWGSYSSVVSYLVLDPRADGSGIIGLTNEIAPTNESGVPVDGAKDLGDSARRWKDLYLSGGAYLGGTAAANKLDDYEEGTFAPNLSDGTNSVSLGTAYYRKIGSIVTVFISAYNTSFASLGATSLLRVTGLPFTQSSGFNTNNSLATNTTSGYQVVTEITGTTAFIYLNNAAVDYVSFTRNSGVGGASTFTFRTMMAYSTDA